MDAQDVSNNLKCKSDKACPFGNMDACNSCPLYMYYEGNYCCAFVAIARGLADG